MNNDLQIAIVAGGMALLGSLITGWFTYLASASEKETQKYKRRLIQTYQDIAAFHRLEEKYISLLASPEKSADGWKKDVRKELREEGFASPSEEATVARAEAKLRELA